MCLSAVFVAALSAGAVAATPADARIVFERYGKLTVAGNDGTHRRSLGAGTAPVASPDGRWVAYLRHAERRVNGRGDDDLYVRRTSGGPPRRLLTRAVGDISWDHHSRLIAIERQALYYRVGPQIRKPKRLIDIGANCGASFAPDGRLAIAECGLLEVLDRRLDPLSTRNLTDGYYPAWGRSGLAFTEIRGDIKVPGPKKVSLRFIPNGGRAETLLEDAGPVAWSADGRFLLTSASPGRSLIFDIRDRSTRQVSDTGLPIGFSADGETVLVRRLDGIHTINVESGRDALAAPEATNATFARIR